MPTSRHAAPKLAALVTRTLIPRTCNNIITSLPAIPLLAERRIPVA
jgi:hypothetical protein